MKIFPKNSSIKSKSIEKKDYDENDKPINKKKIASPLKKEMSASAIREKLASHVETSDAAKTMTISKTKKFGENFMSETIKPIVDIANGPAKTADGDIKTPNTKNLTIKSDIAFNDPKDTNTQEKLKSALSKGAFNFNPKERAALEKILGG